MIARDGEMIERTIEELREEFRVMADIRSNRSSDPSTIYPLNENPERILPYLSSKVALVRSNSKIRHNVIWDDEIFICRLFSRHPWLECMDNRNIVVAGGTAVGVLIDVDFGSDVDLFIVGLKTPEEVAERLKEIYFELVGVLKPEKISRCGSTITLDTSAAKIQIIGRLYDNLAHVLNTFDVQCCGIGCRVDTRDVGMSYAARFSFSIGCNNIIDLGCSGPLYVDRLVKYLNRGFGFYCPQLTEYYDVGSIGKYKIIYNPGITRLTITIEDKKTRNEGESWYQPCMDTLQQEIYNIKNSLRGVNSGHKIITSENPEEIFSEVLQDASPEAWDKCEKDFQKLYERGYESYVLDLIPSDFRNDLSQLARRCARAGFMGLCLSGVKNTPLKQKNRFYIIVPSGYSGEHFERKYLCANDIYFRCFDSSESKRMPGEDNLAEEIFRYYL